MRVMLVCFVLCATVQAENVIFNGKAVVNTFTTSDKCKSILTFVYRVNTLPKNFSLAIPGGLSEGVSRFCCPAKLANTICSRRIPQIRPGKL
jgi:hypothetical protein